MPIGDDSAHIASIFDSLGDEFREALAKFAAGILRDRNPVDAMVRDCLLYEHDWPFDELPR